MEEYFFYFKIALGQSVTSERQEEEKSAREMRGERREKSGQLDIWEWKMTQLSDEVVDRLNGERKSALINVEVKNRGESRIKDRISAEMVKRRGREN